MGREIFREHIANNLTKYFSYLKKHLATFIFHVNFLRSPIAFLAKIPFFKNIS